jgi:hypothetical protein
MKGSLFVLKALLVKFFNFASIPGETLAARCNNFELARADLFGPHLSLLGFCSSSTFKFEFILMQSQAENMH